MMQVSEASVRAMHDMLSAIYWLANKYETDVPGFLTEQADVAESEGALSAAAGLLDMANTAREMDRTL